MPIDEKQITNRQHAVPQNIMEVEFKIIGEMTLREFIYLAVFGALAYFSAMTVGNLLKWPMVFFFGGTGIIFAFLPINDRGMDEWVANFLRAIYNPTQKVWRKTPEIPRAFTFENLAFVRNELITLAPTTTRRKLENYLDSYNQVEEQKEDYEKKEEEFIKKVRDTYAYYKMEEKNQPYTVQVPELQVQPNVETELLPSQLPKPVLVNKQHITGVIPMGQEAQADKSIENALPTLSFDIKAVFKQMNQHASPVQPAQDIPVPQVQQAPPVIEPIDTTISVVEEVVSPTTATLTPQEEAPQQTSPVMQRLLDQISKTKQEQHITTEEPNKDIARIEAVKHRLDPIDRQTSTEATLKDVKARTYPKINLLREFSLAESNKPLTPSITPDRMSGRMFTPLALNNEGEIILPIRGERVLKVNNQTEVDIEKQLEEKTKQLQQVLDQIRMESGTLPKQGVKETPAVDSMASTDAQRTEENIKKLQAENQKLIEEMAKVKVEMAKASQVKSNFDQQEQIIGSAKIEQEVLLGRITELQKKLEEQTKKQKEEERQREEKRIEEERNQEETLRLMIKMQKDKEAPRPGQTFAPAPENKPKPNQTPKATATEQGSVATNTQTPLHTSLATPEAHKTIELNSPTTKEVVLPKPNPQAPVPTNPPSFGKQILTSSPNVITGIVKNTTGNVMDNVLIIIKRPTGEPVRALKTNKLGVFAITTPLGDGEYVVELDKAKHTGLTFNATKVVLDGKVLPPLEFIGKQNV